ncbi:peptidase M50 [Magnetococcus marinus MC-1]|uniref:Peptidase M50 n=1 Tax=Magnetococcus marinus (strain ATCC BAA-1437 / JCM 17883 / MC-1) TaxID=156889 RepID=A0L6R7_MAGMM|nr:HlyD family efflux transporter periplasmic adaptor subunit [Magnetococcus marinus]ABK43660.1 peptidase M50 [Magnetococcus marinus MC-1]
MKLPLKSKEIADDLPPLRADLDLYPGTLQENGDPTWTLHDPLRNRFFRIGLLEFSILRRWHLGNFAAILQALAQEKQLAVSQEQCEALLKFLRVNQLVEVIDAASARHIAQMEADKERKNISWLVRNYLFFRIPLLHPDQLMAQLYQGLRFLYHPLFNRGILLVALLSLFLVSRQLDQFSHTFLHFFDTGGFILFVLATFTSKAIHETGHALTAKHYGLQIPTMGVAFLVMWPVLYTDTSESWKLQNRFHRLHIGASGILAELTLAILATLAWSFLADGPLRSAMFYLATISWIITLSINLNPFMRFDGYYLLADYLDIDNLQTRAFALAKWKLRQFLLGVTQEDPEPNMRAKTRRIILIYAYFTWIYRFFLFLGIALVVYHLFFKLLGIILMMVEVVVFLLLPIVHEVRSWYTMRDKIKPSKNIFFFVSVLTLLILLLVIPWQHAIKIPGLALLGQQTVIYPPVSAQIEHVHVTWGQRVTAGQPLYDLKNPDLDYRLRIAQLDYQALLKKQSTFDAQPKTRNNRLVVDQQIQESLALIQGLREELGKLQVNAPHAGVLLDVPEWLRAGAWVNLKQPLGHLVEPASLSIKGYLHENELHRVNAATQATFIPEQPELATLPATLVEISKARTPELEEPYLASLYGGAIAIREDNKSQLETQQSYYRVQLQPQTMPKGWPASRVVRGVIHLEGGKESLLQRASTFIAAVVIRESGF